MTGCREVWDDRVRLDSGRVQVSAVAYENLRAQAQIPAAGIGDMASLCMHTEDDNRRVVCLAEAASEMRVGDPGTAAQHRSRGRQSGSLAWHGGQIIQALGVGSG